MVEYVLVYFPTMKSMLKNLNNFYKPETPFNTIFFVLSVLINFIRYFMSTV